MPHRIGCVLAHPDDETFCVGGILAKYAAAGSTIDLLAASRVRELADAARILGIQSIEMAGYGDGTLGALDPTPLIGDIVSFVGRKRPRSSPFRRPSASTCAPFAIASSRRFART